MLSRNNIDIHIDNNKPKRA